VLCWKRLCFTVARKGWIALLVREAFGYTLSTSPKQHAQL